ncbi:MAG: hypothetical protein KME05_24060 [Gloeocapsa sp. UFS-A4-WI-NPMV-4B04]|nr:hypothetical protein [Gloeocapsa sp. UFS-A4-WI-NPMV-4B04]
MFAIIIHKNKFADVHFQPEVLRKTIALCLEQQFDHLTVAPEVYSQSFWLDVTLAAFSLTFFTKWGEGEVPPKPRMGFHLLRSEITRTD